MRRKALRSLEAARRLLAMGFVDEAASRTYFALFQAGVHGLEKQGLKPGDFRAGATHWEHRTVARSAERIRGEPSDVDLFERARDLRLTSDYNRDSVLRKDLEFLRYRIERFVLEVTA
ncbi:MAG TPA: hypothetical protein VFV36_01255 [Candidatus Methylomirabilis sp.]|nr:hypothetical protein [Candidatus Methylomirabilis sp.]